MRRLVEAIMLLAVLLLCSSTTAGHAQQTNWASVSSVLDTTGNVAVASGSPLLAGHTYNLSLTVAVPFTQNSSTFTVRLAPAFVIAGPQFWYMKSPKYAGYDAARFTPGSHNISFTQVQGSILLDAVFTIPLTFTGTTVGSWTLRFIQIDVPVVSIQVTGGSIVGAATYNVSDEAIQLYLTTYAQKSVLISSGKVDSSYTTLVSGVLSQAQDIYLSGLPEQATSLLDTLSPSSLPAPPNTTVTLALIGTLAVMSVLAVMFFVMMLRSRARQGFTKDAMGEAQKELASLEIVAAKYDKALADKLRGLKDKLGDAL